MRWAEATLDRVEYVARNLRESDRTEVQLSHGADPYEVTLESWGQSEVCFAIESGAGEPIGVTGLDGNLIWLLGTDQLTANKRRCMQLCKEGEEWVRFCLSCVDGPIGNYVYAKNRRSIRWLRALGFAVYAPQPHGPSAALFRPFWRSA